MAVKSPVTSNLNPDAPLFVPHSYQMVEDFSPEWWKLVQTSPAFRDYWMHEVQPALEEDELSLPDELVNIADTEGFLETAMDAEDVFEQEMELEEPLSTMAVNTEEEEDALKSSEAGTFDMKDLVASLKIPEAMGFRLLQKHQPSVISDNPPKVVSDESKELSCS